MPISGTLLSSGAINPPTPSDLPPHLSHPATEVSTPTIPAPGLSEATWMSTPLPDTPLVLTRPSFPRHPPEQRRVLSGGAVSSAASTSQPPPLFLRDHNSHDTHTRCVPPFSPGQSSHDTHVRIAGYFLRGSPQTRHPLGKRPLFLSPPGKDKIPIASPRWGQFLTRPGRHPSPIPVAPGTFLEAVITPTSRPSAPPHFSPGHYSCDSHKRFAGPFFGSPERFDTHSTCAPSFRIQPSKIRQPPE